MSYPCIERAWSSHQAELHGFLRHRLEKKDDAEDVLQEVFIKALRQGGQFCAVENPRAWLFQVARNALTDLARASREHAELPDDLEAPEAETTYPVDALSNCFPRVLAGLPEADRLAITFCDVEGQSQQALAEHLGISLPGAKSRVQRARQRFKAELVRTCNVSLDEEGHVSAFTTCPTPG